MRRWVRWFLGLGIHLFMLPLVFITAPIFNFGCWLWESECRMTFRDIISGEPFDVNNFPWRKK